MADDKHYVPGSFYRICDMTGFKVRAGHTQKMWTNTIRREQSWEPRNAQDFVRGVPDYQNAPEPRPRQTNVFLGPLGTSLTARVNPGAVDIFVESSIRMETGDNIEIMLDTGVYFVTTIGTVPTTTHIIVSDPLPYSASVGAYVIDTSVDAQANINQ